MQPYIMPCGPENDPLPNQVPNRFVSVLQDLLLPGSCHPIKAYSLSEGA
jgi:hypothetical protein